MIDRSPAYSFVERFRGLANKDVKRAIRVALGKFSAVELAALSADWSFWARSKQCAPEDDWKSWGFLTGRGFGKTLAISHHINDEVQAGRALLIGLAAQDEANCIALQVNGPSGLIATSPPWFKARFEASAMQVVWPNGARAFVRTPEVPGKIRGFDYHLSWICELQSWPNATREEALTNFLIATRVGYARLVWDATPKRRHPLLKMLLARAEEDPKTHRIVRGTTQENKANLGPGYMAEMERAFGGTQRGREELLGEMLDDSEAALVKQAWIDDRRRHLPQKLVRRIVSVDPAVTNRKGSDNTGIVELCLGSDDQAYVVGDASGKLDVGKWVDLVLDRYIKHDCSLVLAETNKGGQLVTQALRAAAKERGLSVEVVDKEARPQHVPGKVFVKEVFARGAKEDRAEPVATAYERGRVSHVFGADLGSLEETLTTWEPAPGADSPGDLDALVHGVVELLNLSQNSPDPKTAFSGIEHVAKEIYAPSKVPMSLAFAFSDLDGGRI